MNSWAAWPEQHESAEHAGADIMVVDQAGGDTDVEELADRLLSARSERARSIRAGWTACSRTSFTAAKIVKDRVEYLLGLAATTQRG